MLPPGFYQVIGNEMIKRPFIYKSLAENVYAKIKNPPRNKLRGIQLVGIF